MTPPTDHRRVLLLVNPRREEATQLARSLLARLRHCGIEVVRPADDDVLARPAGAEAVPGVPDATGCELVVVLGGDGTILRGAELARGTGAPVLGINLGHVGFLAEVERDHFAATVERIVERDYFVEDRMALDVTVLLGGHAVAHTWALNEATVEKASRERMIELAVEVDGRPLSTWGCDGVVASTPTGSTAYAFSGGGPVVWPEVEAVVVVPLAAHALFARPLVLAPDALFAVELLPDGEGAGVLWCDGRRTVELPAGARVEVVRSAEPVRLARFTTSPFADRLVKKFDLSIAGWRGRADAPASPPPAAGPEPDAGEAGSMRPAAEPGRVESVTIAPVTTAGLPGAPGVRRRV